MQVWCFNNVYVFSLFNNSPRFIINCHKANRKEKQKLYIKKRQKSSKKHKLQILIGCPISNQMEKI